MDEKMTLLSSYLDDGGWHTEAENVRNGVDLESYENELSLIDWLLRHAHLAQPSQAVDVGAIREVIEEMRDSKYFDRNGWIQDWGDKLTRAIGNAQAEGWSVPEGWEIDVGEKSAAIRHRTGSKLVIKPERGNALLFDLLHQLAKSLPTPPTQATPNAHE